LAGTDAFVIKFLDEIHTLFSRTSLAWATPPTPRAGVLSTGGRRKEWESLKGNSNNFERYDCTATGAGIKTKIHCKFLQRKTGPDGVAHFPEAGSLNVIDDIFSLPINYGMVCCDISKPVIPGVSTITFQRRSLGQTLHWIFIGD
jgi:hypothetical protein